MVIPKKEWGSHTHKRGKWNPMAEAFSLSLTPPQMASLSGAAAASSRLLPRARLGFSTSSSTPSPSSLSLSSLKCLRSSPLLSHLLHRQVLFLSIFVSIFLCDCIDSEPHFLFWFFFFFGWCSFLIQWNLLLNF